MDSINFLKEFKTKKSLSKKSFFINVLILIATVVIGVGNFGYRLLAAPPNSAYSPGETLTPTCAPGSPNCTVTRPAISGANTDITSLGNLLYINSNIGIGTAGPDRKLDILDASNPQLRLTYTDGTKYVDQQSLSTGDWYVSSNLGKLLKTDSVKYNTFLGQQAFNNFEGSYNTGLGYQAGYNNNYTTGDTGKYNTYIGYQTGYGAASGNKNTGYNNSAMGHSALYSNTTGFVNSAMGSYALYSNTTGYNNSAMGYEALYANTTGYNNSAMGDYALYNNTTGYENSAMGYGTLFNNTTGQSNSAMGNGALYYNTTGQSNSAMGDSALLFNTTGTYNIAMGKNAGIYLTNGSSINQQSSNSVFLGYDTRASAAGDTNEIVIGTSATGAGSNSAVLGNDSITKTLLKGSVGIGTASPSKKLDIVGDGINLENTTSASTGIIFKNGTRFIHNFQHPTGGEAVPVGYNTFIGLNAGNFTMGSSATQTYQGSYNSAVGASALYSNTTGYLNSAMGHSALYSNTTGGYNSAMGYQALYFNTAGNSNSAMGYRALSSNTDGNSNSAMGHSALYSNTTGLFNSAVGASALRSNTAGVYNSAMGDEAIYSNTSGDYNSAVGASALYSNTAGSYNSAVGYQALSSNTTGYKNSAVGYRALFFNTTGTYNIAMGQGAGMYLTNGSSVNQTSNNSIFLGNNTRASTAGGSNEIVIGSSATGAGSNSAVLGNDSITKTLLKGSVGIGTANPGARLDIGIGEAGAAGDYFLSMRSNTATTADVKFRFETNGNALADGAWIGGGADYAEYFYTNDVDLAAGELVCLNLTTPNTVSRCQSPKDNNVIGIVSIKPSHLGNYHEGVEQDPHYVMIAMLGQVKTRVNLDNGEIKVGDLITSSNVPGVGQRAELGDPSVGLAMEGFNGDNSGAASGEILVLISRNNKGWSWETVGEKFQSIVKNTLSQLGIIVEDGLVKLKRLAIDSLMIGSPEQPSGIVMFDEETGEQYCVRIRGGVMISEVGDCDDPKSETLNPKSETNPNDQNSNIQGEKPEVVDELNVPEEAPETSETVVEQIEE